MRIVLGMLVPDTSEVHWCGQRMNNESRHGVGHIPQDHGQTFPPTVRCLSQRAG
jgi:ABC-type Mn2+/Zn2+ transport system ATPase subunit